MFIQVRASNPASDGRSRAGRRFLNGQVYRMEVIEDEPGQPPLDAKALTDADGLPDMGRISRAGYEQVKADPVMSVLEGGSTDVMLSQEAFDEVRAQLKRSLGEVADLKILNATLQGKADERDELLGEVADLKAQLVAATATHTQTAPALLPGGTPVDPASIPPQPPTDGEAPAKKPKK